MVVSDVSHGGPQHCRLYHCISFNTPDSTHLMTKDSWAEFSVLEEINTYL